MPGDDILTDREAVWQQRALKAEAEAKWATRELADFRRRSDKASSRRILDLTAEVEELRRSADMLASELFRLSLQENPETARVLWLCASSDPESDVSGIAMGGRVLHAVPGLNNETHRSIASRRAACGRRAVHGWVAGLFNTKKCARCLRAMKLACSQCQGTGKLSLDSAHSLCTRCMGSGEEPKG